MDQFISNHLAGVSRTYAIVIPMLPPELAEPVGLAYLLLRIVDTLEDTPTLSEELRRRLFQQLTQSLEPDAQRHVELPTTPVGQTEAERKLMRDLPEVLARIRALPAPAGQLIRHCAKCMIAGVCDFFDRAARRGEPYPAIRTIGELRQYCYYVAGIVGQMLCDLLADHLRLPALTRLRAQAVNLGVGLQLVNIVKDCLTDAQHGRRYLPPKAAASDATGNTYQRVVEEARRRLARGVEFVLALPAQPAGPRLFCGLPLAWGALTLTRACPDPAHAKISRSVIWQTVEQFQRLVANDETLSGWLASLLTCPSAQARAASASQT